MFDENLNSNKVSEKLLHSNLSEEEITRNRIEDNDDFIPIWEKKFVEIIEKMKSVPYVSLMHFTFLPIIWLDKIEEEDLVKNDEIVNLKEANILEKSRWSLVKNFIWNKSRNTIEKGFQDKQHLDKSQTVQSVPEKKSLDLNFKSSNNLIQKSKKGLLDLFSNLVPAKFQTERKQKLKTSNKNNSDLLKIGKSFRIIGALQKMKKKTKNKIKLKKKTSFRNIKKDTSVDFDSNLIKSFNSQKSISTSNENQGKVFSGKTNSKILPQIKLNDLDGAAIKKNNHSFILNYLIFDFNEINKYKKLKKFVALMDKDDGPILTDYRALLGVEFWAKYCGINQNLLIEAASNEFWSDNFQHFFEFSKPVHNQAKYEINTINDLNIKEKGLLVELKQFLRGTNLPVRAPQRIVSSEEKFRLIPYPRLLNPNTDLKKTLLLNTIHDRLKKKLEKLYTWMVHLLGGKYPLIRHIGMEEAFEDYLLWVLDTDQAKTRLVALLNDQINLKLN